MNSLPTELVWEDGIRHAKSWKISGSIEGLVFVIADPSEYVISEHTGLLMTQRYQ